jgi:transposase
MVEAAERGCSLASLAEWAGRSRQTVRFWLRRYRAAGVAGLADAPRSGRPPKADAAYLAAVEPVVQRSPRAVGLAVDVWTSHRLSAYLASTTGVRLSAGRLRWHLHVRRAQGALGEAETLLQRVARAHEERHGHLAYADLWVLPLAELLRAAGRRRAAADLYRRFVRDLAHLPFVVHPSMSGANRRRVRWSGRLFRDARVAGVLDEYAALLAEMGRPTAARGVSVRAARLRAGVEARRRAYSRAGPDQEAVYVDFNTLGTATVAGEERVRIGSDEVRPSFRDGLRVVLFDEELRVEAVLGCDAPGRWWARPDWSTLRDLPPP